MSDAAATKRPLAAVRSVKEMLERTDRDAGRIWARAEMEAERLEAIATAEGDQLVRRRAQELSVARDRLEGSTARAASLLRLLGEQLLRSAGEVAVEAAHDPGLDLRQERSQHD